MANFSIGRQSLAIAVGILNLASATRLLTSTFAVHGVAPRNADYSVDGAEVSMGAAQESIYRSPAVPDLRTCTYAYNPCYELSTDYHGSDVKLVVDNSVASAEACHLICLAFPACHFWTWVSWQRNCYLKNQHAPRGRIHAPGSISGPRQCYASFPGGRCHPKYDRRSCKEPECYDHNSLYTGTEVEMVIVEGGPAACQYSCQQHPLCTNFSYLLKEKKCMLKSAVSASTCQIDAVSGPKFCYSTACARKDVEYYGKKLETKFRPSIATCHKVCQFNPLCSAVTFYDASQQCSLIQRAEHASGYVSGPKWCTSRGRENRGMRMAAAERGVAYAGSLEDPVCYNAGVAHNTRPFSATHTLTIEACHSQCQSNPRCKSFTFFLFGKVCLMHDGEGREILNETASSGPRECAPSSCFHEDVEAYGKDVGNCRTQTAAACQRVCQGNARCTLFAYHTASKVCWLRQHRGRASGTTSAPVFCGMPDDHVMIVHKGPADPHKPPKPETPQAPGMPGNPGAPAKPDVTGKEKPTKPEDPKKPEDTGKTENGGIIEDAGKIPSSETPEDPKKPDDTDKPDVNGTLPESPIPTKPDVDTKPTAPPESECFALGLYYDSVALTESLEKSLEDCQTECVKHELCNYFSFFRDDGRCTLHASTGNKMLQREAVSGQRECGQNLRSTRCLVEGEYSGDQIDFAQIMSLGECHKFCFTGKECNFFSFNSRHHTCKRFKTVTTLRKDNGSVSGLTKCESGRTNPCIQEGVACSGKPQSNPIQTASREDCEKNCQASESCMFYSYQKSSNKCTLIADFRRDVVDNSAVCGSKFCLPLSYNPQCFQRGYTNVSPATNPVDVQSLTECYLLCEKNAGCRFFFYENRKCQLGTEVNSLQPRGFGEAGRLHCPQNFLAEGCVTKHARYTGQEFETFAGVATPGECKEKCKTSALCRFFSHTKKGACTLFKNRRGHMFEVSTTSGWRSCPLESMCTPASYINAETPTSLVLIEDSHEDCKKQCSTNPLVCSVASYEPAGKKCTMAPVFRTEPGLISGILSCDSSTSAFWSALWGGQTPKIDDHNDFECIQDNISFSQAPSSVSSFDSAQKCQRACQRHHSCRFFSFEDGTKMCSLYNTEATPTARDLHKAGPAFCSPPPVDCTVMNTAVDGFVKSNKKTNSYVECKQFCEGSSAEYYTFDTHTHLCTCGVHRKARKDEKTILKACLGDSDISNSG